MDASVEGSEAPKRRESRTQVAVFAGRDVDVTERINALLRSIPPHMIESVNVDTLDANEQTFQALVTYRVWAASGAEEG